MQNGMQSKIRLECDFSNDRKPIIRFTVRKKSDHTLDALAKNFFELLEHQSSWLKVKQSDSSEHVSVYDISPISPTEFSQTILDIQEQQPKHPIKVNEAKCIQDVDDIIKFYLPEGHACRKKWADIINALKKI